MPNKPNNPMSPAVENGPEDWPTDETIITRCLSTSLSYGNDRLFQASPLQTTDEKEWPSDNEMETSSTRSPSGTLTSHGDEESEATSPGPSQSDMVVNLTRNNDCEVIDLTDLMEGVDESFHPPSGRNVSKEETRTSITVNLRDSSVNDSSVIEIDQDPQDIELRPSMSVLLEDGSYLRIEKVIVEDGKHFLSGRYLLQTNDHRVNAFVPKVAGELIWVTNVTTRFSVDQVRGIRNIRFTNARSTWQPLTDFLCRLKLIEGIRGSLTTRVHERHYEAEHAVEYLTVDETDEGYGWSATVLRDDWRGVGETTLFGDAELPVGSSSMNAMATATPLIIDLVDTTPPVIDLTVSRDHTYTFGDAFCGAGGTSCGARQAGLSVRWGCDKDPDAIETYSSNFDAIAYHAFFDQLMAMPEAELRVDVCHCSPPCQPFSPAHTVNNQERDELNSACIFAARNLLQRARPRVLTMEETSGLYERHKETMHRVILDIIEEGYSVRWSILDCFHYGVPQCRKRLLIIAAGPGEKLPGFPPATHALPGEGLLPPVTIHDAINNIPDPASNHDVQNELNKWARSWHAPYNAYSQAKTITCNGGEANYHPSGRRKFTEREVACLQTFPLDFEFPGRNVRRQIGNAVPVKFAETIYREIARSLRETDEEELQEQKIRERELLQAGARVGT